MSKFKKIGIILTVVVLTFLLTGCGSKSVKTTKDFTALANSYNLSTQNVKESQYASDDSIKEGYVAYNNNWQIEFYVLDTVKINGEEKNKVQMFDELLRKEPSIIEQYPILQIEYNLDGTKKALSQIMHSLELKCSTDKDEDEASSIADCILRDIQEISEFEYNELSKYTSNSTFISNMIKQFLSRVSIVKNENLTLKLGIESCSIETPYIDQTYEEITSQDRVPEQRESNDS